MGENHIDSNDFASGTGRPAGAVSLSLKGKTTKTR